MKRILCLAVTTLTVAACGDAPRRGPPPANHPILGIWTIAVTPTCSETDILRADGTSYETSAEEITESKYTISAKPNGGGIYTFTDTITKANGKPDCNGSIVPVGSVATAYIRFNATGDRMLNCYDTAMTQCLVMRRAGRTE